MITPEEADKVLEEQLRKATVATDEAGLAAVETGLLLEESRTAQRLSRSPDALVMRRAMARPEYLIPSERDQPGYPRSFVVLYRSEEKKQTERTERTAGLYYFLQAEAGCPWKAAAKTWAIDKPAVDFQSGEFDDHFYGNFHFEVRDKPIAAVVRDASGAVALSPTAAEDRSVCGRFAQYLSFTAPDGKPESEHFVPGKLTGEVVAYYNSEEGKSYDGRVTRSYAFESAGTELPVLRLADGKSLVTCSLVRKDHWEGTKGAWIFSHGNKDTSNETKNRLMGGGNRKWLSTDVRNSVTATIEVPAQGPADVVACNCLNPPVLSAEGTPDE
ncbi:hypothetical protein ABZY44_33675 [Streptomyces sp. NPDC006544]|uniref:hypothetical protein n=1 Tax=Streptomyces sp. NPDC006544 TaxID=3154583 RepID=UPI0033A26E00